MTNQTFSFNFINRNVASVKDFFKLLRRTPQLTNEEEFALLATIAQGGEGEQEALEKVLLANLGFVARIAHRCANSSLLSFEDLLQEGIIGLQKAIQAYDINRGLKLITFAKRFIAGAINDAIARSRGAVRIPESQQRLIKDYKKTACQFYKDNCYDLSFKEYCEMKDFDYSKYADFDPNFTDPDSLDSPIFGESGVTYADVLVGDFDVEAGLNKKSKCAEVRMMMKCYLTERESFVLRKLFGFDSPFEETLSDIAAELGISTESVRLAKESGLKKIAKHLHDSPYLLAMAA